MRVDLICEVIDNFGDAGISWRLARQLASEWQASVRLFIDCPGVLARWQGAAVARGEPVPQVHALQTIEPLCETPGELVILMLGTTLPAPVRAMLAAKRIPWVRYEYLSAEAWIDGCHGLASIKPEDGAVEWFFYPGYTTTSGGLLRESTLPDELNRFGEYGVGEYCAGETRIGESECTRWARDMALDTPEGDLRVCLFGYPEPVTAALVQAFAALSRPSTLFIHRTLADQLVHRSLPNGPLPPHCKLRPHDWLDQPDFDRLLASCDVSLVRGEDSWVRAQWTGRPFLWQAYRQDVDVHRDKLEAWLDRMLADASPAVSDTVRAMMRAVNPGVNPAPSAPDLNSTLARYVDQLDAIRSHHIHWRDTLLAQPPLVARLATFARDHLQLTV